MRVGYDYNCKIKLHGEVKHKKNDGSVLCKVIKRDYVIGCEKFVLVDVNDNEYFVLQDSVLSVIQQESFYYLFTRKDLIQVNKIIHGDLL